MSSLTICVPSQEIATFIYDILNNKNKSFQTSMDEKSSSFYINISYQVKDKKDCFNVVEECIVKVVVKFYKDKYFADHLHIPFKDETMFNELKETLLYFDKEHDCYLIHKHLKFTSVLNLESFYYFKLKVLRDNWDGYISIVNESYFQTPRDFWDFVSWLKRGS